MKGKKGMVIQQIVYIALSLIVLVVLIGIPLYDYVNTQYFGGKGAVKWITEKEKPFAPYAGAKLGEDDQKTQYSVEALICATNIVASQNSDYNCVHSVKTDACEKSYGASCVKCQKEINGLLECYVKDFELPQRFEEKGMLAKINPINWISANGDPNYLVYYEAFPVGEEEAWVLDAAEVSLSTIAFFDIALPVGGAVLKGGKDVVRKGAELASNTRVFKLFKLSAKLGGIYYVYKLASVAGRMIKTPIAWTAKKISQSIKSGIEYIEGKIIIKYPEYYIKMFSDAESILKYASPEEIKKILGKDAPDVAVALSKDDKETLEIAELISKDSGLTASSASFAQKMMDVPANIKPLAERFGKNALFLAAALIAKKEDSMNEKFYPVGINAVGFKKPYNEAFISGENLPKLSEEAGSYYISLRKPNEDAEQRFYLASPCKADLSVNKRQCPCYKTDDTEKITVNGQSFFVQKTSIDKEKNNYDLAVKECREASWSENLFESELSKTDCIRIIPENIQGFCFYEETNEKYLARAGSWALYIGQFGTGMIAQALKPTLIIGGAAGGPLGLAAGYAASLGVGGIQTIMDYGLALGESWLTSQTKWPNH